RWFRVRRKLFSGPDQIWRLALSRADLWYQCGARDAKSAAGEAHCGPFSGMGVRLRTLAKSVVKFWRTRASQPATWATERTGRARRQAGRIGLAVGCHCQGAV